MKQKFFDTFASFHRAKLNTYFEKGTPLDQISKDSASADVSSLNQAFDCQSKPAYMELNAYLNCDFYSSEITNLTRLSESVIFQFLIKISQPCPQSIIFESNTPQQEFDRKLTAFLTPSEGDNSQQRPSHLTFELSIDPNSNYYEVRTEWLDFDERCERTWNDLIFGVEEAWLAETLGSEFGKR